MNFMPAAVAVVVRKAFRVHQGLLAPQDRQERLEPLVPLAQLDPLVQLVRLEPLVLLVQLEHQERLDHKAFRAQLVLLDHRAFRALLALALRVHLVYQVFKEQLVVERKELLEKLVDLVEQVLIIRF